MSYGSVSEGGSVYAVDCHSYKHITSATDTVIKGSPAVLVRIVINTTAAGTITIYDNAAASGTVVGIIQASAGVGNYEYGIRCNNGITITTGAASDLTVVYE